MRMRTLGATLLVALTTALLVAGTLAPPAVAAQHQHHKRHHHHHHKKKHHKKKHHKKKHHHRQRHHHKAADRRTWERLAACESGGRWHINTHNGYYGGLQISAGTWRAFGGKRLASLPQRASKQQQIRVAERIRKGQGWGAWPTCSRRIGKR